MTNDPNRPATLPRERLEQRLGELRAEGEKGQALLADLDAQRVEIRDSLLRIAGAIQVLEEQLREIEASTEAPAAEVAEAAA